jgi:WhiB family transcriptional regulator, redox-sensing transcriptional regulator
MISPGRAIAHDPVAWQLRGSCRGVDPEMFFPVGTSGPSAARARAAKRICHDCPVIAQCLTWALRRGEDWGRVGWPQRI